MTTAPPSTALTDLRDRLRQFATERDWDQFHSPKNLASALSVEVAELLEHFQWMTEAESLTVDADRKVKITKEIADVLLYLIRIADKLDVDLLAAADAKLRVNAAKYPKDRARGSSRKYTEI